jgi:L-lactate dehydrogenase
MMRCKKVVTTLYRASSTARVPCLAARYTTKVATTSDFKEQKKTSTIDLGPAEMLRSHMQNLRLKDSLDPIPFTDDISVIPLNDSPDKIFHKKVSIIGCGQVGMGIAFALLNQTAAGTIALIDTDASKLEAEAKDLEQGSGFYEHVRILAGAGYEVSAHSHLVIITAGVAQKPGESRLNLMEKNVAIMKNIIPNVLAHSPDAAICIVSNPCDIMTAVAAKIAGASVPAGRIFGSGTCLDSSRLQSLIAKTLDIDARAVQGYVVGEHGDNSVPLWSSVRVGGVHMLQPGHEPEDIHRAMHKEIINAAYNVIEKKGYTNWAVGLTGAYIGKAVLNDQRNVFTVSTCVRGMHGIEEDVFLSMPCSIGAHGVRRIINTPMTKSEKAQFVNAAKAIWNIQKGVWDKI